MVANINNSKTISATRADVNNITLHSLLTTTFKMVIHNMNMNV